MFMTRHLCRLAALALLGVLAAAAPASAATTNVEAESFSGGTVFASSGASGGAGLLLRPALTVSKTVTTVAAAKLVVGARGDQCNGAPRMRVDIDGATVMTQDVKATSWSTYTADTAVLAGSHTLTVSFLNDYHSSSCDRNLRLDYVRLQSIDTAATNPLTGRKLYVDPANSAVQTAAAWRISNPLDALQLDKIASRPQADWYGDFTANVQAAVAAQTTAATVAGSVPTLVAYNIPQRDCGSYSAGGATSADAYKAWIRSFAAGIGSNRAIVIVEPDALASLDCLAPADRATRFGLIADAVNVLAAQPNVETYIDIGHSTWLPSDQAAGRLWKAGVANARGFSLNVSNYNWSANENAYGKDVSARLGGKGFVVDTSRNGQGPAPAGEWCNPAGRGLGASPSVATGTGPDANLWVKRPGESDGTCNGGPSAGIWWPQYAVGLAQRAAL
jgi:endoglucanase